MEDNSTLMGLLLKKRHMALAYHFVRESVAAGIIHPAKIPGRNNVADVLTKPLAHDPFTGLTNLMFHG